LLGDKPHSYGTISERAKTLRDDYEYVYRHYRRAGILFPHVQRAADSVRAKAGRSVLAAVRAKPEPTNPLTPTLVTHLGIVGAGAGNNAAAPNGAIVVNPGEPVQQALDKAAGSKGVVLLKAGIHALDTTLLMPSGVTLTGEGLQTVLHLSASGGRDAIVNATADMSDVTISNLLLEGSLKTEPGTDPNGSRSFRSNAGNRGGIIFRAQHTGQMKRLRFENITIQNCTFNGLLISGAEDVTITGCNFSENGGGVVPGPKLQHNVFINHSRNITVRNNRTVTSPFGCGIALLQVSNAAIDHNEVARNGFYGILVTESGNVQITDNLVEANDRSGVMLEYLYRGSSNVLVSDNQIQYNNGFGLESYATARLKQENNLFAGNGTQSSQQKISNEKFIVME
jgi:parallel beta-helix repeat protein